MSSKSANGATASSRHGSPNLTGGCEAQPAKTAPQAWNAEQTQQDVEDRIAWMKRMDAVEEEQAARDAEAAK
ncbi:MAG: hypothetical protein ACFNKE_03015, partial [Neisseria elongata]